MTTLKAANMPANKHEVEVIEKIVDAILENKSRPVIAALEETVQTQKTTISRLEEILTVRDSRLKTAEGTIAAQAATIATLMAQSTPQSALETAIEKEWLDEDQTQSPATNAALNQANRRIDRMAVRASLSILLTIVNLIGLGFIIYNLS